MLTQDEMRMNSTFRELKAMYYVLLSYADQLRNKRVKIFTDNQGAPCIVAVSSPMPHLQAHLQIGSKPSLTTRKYSLGWDRWRTWARSKVGIAVFPAHHLQISLYFHLSKGVIYSTIRNEFKKYVKPFVEDIDRFCTRSGRFLLQVTGHCFTNTESIPNTCKS